MLLLLNQGWMTKFDGSCNEKLENAFTPYFY